MNSYFTVEKETNAEYEIKRSRFIGYIKPVKTKEEAESFVASIKQKHYDARHNVFAYKIRQDNFKRYSDDGEPQGTAGVPVLDVIEKNDLTDVCIVVTRYFGGILLGGGGLVRAYSHTASLAVEAGKKIEMSLCACFEIKCDYSFFGKLNSLIEENGGIIENFEFLDDVCVTGYIPEDLFSSLDSKIVEASAGDYKLTEKDKKFAKI
ncbi:MAG: YigZ family protein [Ruminococcaceae bacterium]|nr:YigZ family protein [Oscillospiraceae bacterium]